MNNNKSQFFFEANNFQFTQILESNWLTIRAELEQVLQREQNTQEKKLSINPEDFVEQNDIEAYTNQIDIQQGGFIPWHQVEIYDGNWDVFGLYGFKQKIPENCKLCPKTTSLVEQIPNMITAGFSALKPGTHIHPHVGYTDKVLRYHLGLIIPNDCALRVGDEIRSWEEGKFLIFDDTFEHEAWNKSDNTRIVLLIDVEK